ncbi:MAG TPA: phosphopantetheine-binding protein [Steroidobacteraceae bacterium]|nr:phosphopantetheine-binding protein [Steroidobacteraceae bacterium]
MSTLDTLQDILIDEFNLTRDQLVPEAELTSLGVDSLDLLELMFKIEDRYKLAIRDDVPTDLTTVGDVVVYVDDLLARQAKARDAGSGDLHAAT